MRVLVTGGYGFIGSFVAEKFLKEGHDIYIIDNLSTGNKENVNFKHKFFHLNVEDPACEEVFHANRFEVVIHLAAQVNVGTSMENPYLDSQSNVLGLANILQLSKKFGVKKVVFASSAAVYGLNEDIPLKEEAKCDPLSPYGINKWVGEIYCKKWSEVFGMDTLCFRFSNVYGPKQGTIGEGGAISIFINNVLDGKELHVFGDGEQTRDFIYVEDVANAIFRGVEYDLSGIYNLSTNTEISLNEFIHALKSIAGVKGVLYKEPKKGDIKYSRLDNSRIKKDLDWIPLHSFDEGLGKTYEWFKDNSLKKKRHSEKRTKSKWAKTAGPALPYLENLAVFILAIFVHELLQDSLNLIDYRLFYIVIASFLFGRSQSILSIGLASLWYLVSNVLGGQEIISQLIDHNTLVTIGLYVFIGLTLGYLLEKKEKLIQSSRAEAILVQEKYRFLTNIYKDTLTVKNELQDQILYTNDSVGTVYQVIKELDSLQLSEIYTSAITITEEIMKTKGTALYILDDSQKCLRLEGKSVDLIVPDSIQLSESKTLMEVFKTGLVQVNKSLEGNLPTMMAPISIGGSVVGVIGVYNPQFEYLTLAYQNLFAVIANLISSAINRVYNHEQILESNYIQRKKKEEAHV
ncbi:NAD-dependent epimerase/dehydratase family protein [Bacillus paramycoides]|uniref:UDP-glucose 4-epimerase n=1 Tax=Bacillus paramycoides TaxID=2026194 RepID=A0ABU6N1E3_9BACI|nr:NAD-dependent epimerase/dehydratase family protein [Bacillus paramycoides]MED1568635.1 NAD-dependent epimerase/dehydratase family protein [Bacillus paramycoides]